MSWRHWPHKIANAAGSEAATVAGAATGPISDALDETAFGAGATNLGAGMSLAGAAANGYLLGGDIANEGTGAYHDSTAYNHAGGMALGATEAVLPYTGPYGAAADVALTTGALGTDMVGGAAGRAFGPDAGFSSDSVAGGLIRYMAGDKSIGNGVRKGVGPIVGDGAVGTAVGIAAQIGTNVVMAPSNAADAITGGIGGEAGAIGTSIETGTGTVGGAINSGAHAVATTTAAVAGDVGHGASVAAQKGESAGSTAVHATEDTAGAVTSDAGKAVDKAKSGAKKVLKKL